MCLVHLDDSSVDAPVLDLQASTWASGLEDFSDDSGSVLDPKLCHVLTDGLRLLSFSLIRFDNFNFYTVHLK